VIVSIPFAPLTKHHELVRHVNALFSHAAATERGEVRAVDAGGTGEGFFGEVVMKKEIMRNVFLFIELLFVHVENFY